MVEKIRGGPAARPTTGDVCGQRPRATIALVIAFVLAASCSSTPPRSAIQIADDRALANNVYAALNADPVYFFRHVDVRVDNGVAEISGYVWSTDAIYQARKIAMKVPGITGVSTNQLQLERNGRDTGPAR